MGSAWGVAAITGIAIGVQVSIIGSASRTIHPLLVSLALQGTGLLWGTLWLARRGGWTELAGLAGRWWLLPLGLVGWGIVAALGFAAARIGAGATLAIVVATQVTTGLVLDAADGLRPAPHQALGVVLLAAGATLLAART